MFGLIGLLEIEYESHDYELQMFFLGFLLLYLLKIVNVGKSKLSQMKPKSIFYLNTIK